MKFSLWIAVFLITVSAGMTGCEKNKSPVDRAVDNTKDALDMREHEKLKDAGENARDAVKDATEGLREEAR